jgi:curved DNA-binding protein CbpA
MYARATESFRMSSKSSTVNRLGNDFYAVLGVKRTATQEDIRDAFKKLASQYHPDRNKDEEAARRFKEISEAYFVLSDPAQRHLYDVLGPEKYDDPREVMFYKLNQEAANRELEREYEKERSARQYNDAGGLAFMIFIVLVVDLFIPSWVLGPWFYVFNAFFIPAIAFGIYDSFKS